MEEKIVKCAVNAKTGQLPGSLALAFLGDTVYDLYVRARLVADGGRVKALNASASKTVCAHAQSDANMAAAAKRLDQTRSALEQIESTLAKADLPDSLLQSLRQQLDPIAANIQSVVDEVSPRADAVKTRLDRRQSG